MAVDWKQYFSGDFLDDFEIMKELGSGTYGKVYKVRSLKTGESFALKELKDCGSRRLPESFKREIELLGQLQHPYIIQFKGLVLKDRNTSLAAIDWKYRGELYVAMELGGKSLRDVIKAGKMDSHKIKSYLGQLLMATEYIHRMGVVHRDIKAENVVVQSDDTIRIIDFGLSRFIDRHKMTRGCGTPAYSSPEILCSRDTYNESVDIFSLGILFAEMLSGELLFKSRDTLDQVIKICEFNAKQNHKLAKCSSKALQLLQGMLAPRAAQRLSATACLRSSYFS